MKTINQFISEIGSFWSEPDGFFYLLRQGQFDVDKWESFLRVLQEIDFNGERTVSLEVVRLLWFVPTFMKWQIERVQEGSGNVGLLEDAISTVEEEYIRIWGIP